jgi:phosphoribosylglycinamide formyltransferase 1
MPKRRVAVLVSGKGSNLTALLERAADPEFPGEIVLVLSNRTEAAALEIARRWKVPCKAFPAEDYRRDRGARDQAMLEQLRESEVELIVCAGYNMLITDELLKEFPDAIINVHPSLLPAFGGGMNAVEDALAYGVKVTGCTVQLLEPGEADGGPIILQATVPIEPDDDAESLRQRIHEQEWEILPEAVGLWCSNRLVRDGRQVRIASPQLTRA